MVPNLLAVGWVYKMCMIENEDDSNTKYRNEIRKLANNEKCY